MIYLQAFGLFDKDGSCNENKFDDENSERFLDVLGQKFGIRSDGDRKGMVLLIDRLIQHRLYCINQTKYSNMKKFNCPHPYAEQLFHSFCDEQKKLVLGAFKFDGFNKVVNYFWNKSSYVVNTDLINDFFPHVADAVKIVIKEDESTIIYDGLSHTFDKVCHCPTPDALI